jgi:hypothetical protein
MEERARGNKGGDNMKRKRCALVSITAILFLSLVSSASAINGKSNQATLRGLKGFGVLVEKLPPEVEQEGLNRLQLQLEVESKLRMAGIKVLTREEVFRTPGEPYLYINVNVNVAKTESDIYPYSIDMLLIQQVSLLRDPNLTTFAVTWSKGGVGSIGKPILSHLQEYVREMVDIFIKAYLAENPK